MTDNEAQERRREEYVKLCFEVFKHVATLSTAGALVVLAVYRSVSVETWVAVLSLALFGITVLLCLVSMLIAAGYFAESTPRPPSEQLLIGLLTGTLSSFLSAVVLFTLLPIDPPRWLYPYILVLVPYLFDVGVGMPLYQILRTR